MVQKTSAPLMLSSKTFYDAENKLWTGPVLPPIFHPNVSMGHILAQALSRCPENVGQICHEDGHEMRNCEILQSAICVSLNLRDLGLREGDILGFAAGNSRNVAAVIIGALFNGIPINTLDPTLKFSDIIHMYKITQPKLVLCDEENYPSIKRALEELKNPAPIYVFDGLGGVESRAPTSWKSVAELLKSNEGEECFVPPTISDGTKLPAFIVCSSGTTGSPKAVPISHAASGYMFQTSFEIPPTSRIFCFSTLYWISGVLILCRGIISNNIRVIVRKPFSAPLLLELVRDRQLNLIMCHPTQLQLLLLEKFQPSDLRSLMAINCGGSAVPQSLIEQFKVPVTTVYGLSEACGRISTTQLLQGVVVKIIDDNGKNLEVGERGEICVKLKYPFLGYYGNEEATKNTFIDGFLHTGDIGIMDENGVLHVVDRKKDIFKYNNYHVVPTDVEKELLRIPGIGLVSVVGIPHPIFSALPAALIVSSADSQVTAGDIHIFTKANLPQYKWLRGGIYFVDRMPTTASGKVVRRHLTKVASELYEKNPDIGFKY